MAYIILRDIPKYKVVLDMLMFSAQGAFRGFQNVVGGYHEVKVFENKTTMYRAEVIFPLDQVSAVEVLVFRQGILVRDDSEEAQLMAKMAASSQLDRELIDPLKPSTRKTVLNWFGATSEIDQPLNQILLGENETPAEGISRFQTFWSHHQGQPHAALREFQSAFAKMALREDPAAVERLQYLVQAHYNAGESGIALAPDYFIKFAESLKAIFTFCPNALVEGSAFVYGADYLIEDMVDYGEAQDNEKLISAAQALREPLRELGLLA